ncbi:MAG: signal peptidase I [Chloroflexi bacterium HGW-Chloroflexi-10]|nr:MAG: signal peptidase I [Chloroflexi bacterium HGW-Chloroflexi-10]
MKERSDYRSFWRLYLDNYLPDEPVTTDVTLEKPQKSKVGSTILEIFQTLVMALIFYFLIDTFFPRVRVENISMKPTLQPGELLLVNKLAYQLGEPHRGDVMVFHYPGNPSEDYIKRVIGLPGDEVRIEGGMVYVNGSLLDEPYIAAPPSYPGVWAVPEDSFFVLGDNRNQSSDSHSWGFVPLENIVGKALVVYWPLDQIKTLYHPLIVNAAN